MQSLDFPRYENATELDMLTQLLSREQIIDYNEVEWSAFRHSIQGDGLYDFVEHIIPRFEVIRVLAYLRDFAHARLFTAEDDMVQVEQFERECARLIHRNLKESENDQVHGAFRNWPKPNLKRIADGVPFCPPMSDADKIIAKYIPSYPENNGAFSSEIIMYVAHEFVNGFMARAQKADQTREKTDRPIMSQKAYVAPIKYVLMEKADRYIYFQEGPAYQVMWAMCVLMRMPQKKNWWREKFAEGLIDYLNCTQDFKNTKHLMDRALQEISALTELVIPFDFLDEVKPDSDNKPRRPNGVTEKKMVEQLSELLRNQFVVPPSDADKPIVLAQFISADTFIIENNHGNITNL